MLKMEAIVGKILTKDKYVLIELRKTRNVMPWSEDLRDEVHVNDVSLR